MIYYLEILLNRAEICLSLLFIFFLTISTLFYCDGDCIKCHPNLLKNGKLDKEHQILAKCKNCHKITSKDLQKMGSLCGQDCWDCHSIKKVSNINIKEHKVLTKCIDCHIKLNLKDMYQDIRQNNTIFLKDLIR